MNRMDFFWFLITFLLTAKTTDGVNVIQKVKILFAKVGETSAKLDCEHDDNTHFYMYWYKHKTGEMTMLAYSTSKNSANTEPPFNQSKYVMTRPEITESSLEIKSLQASDSATYYCASSIGGASEAHFGHGTKLTVLDSDVTQPKVKVLNPSEKEICIRKKKVTLVCVVTDFYPDHIEVYWQQNGANITYGHKTDDRALRVNKGKFSITSRLRISLQKWYNLRNSFTCMASFFNGYNNYTTHSHTINGARGDVLQKGDIISRSQWAKLSYGALVAKSVLYGIFIFIVVWKLKGSGAKK